MRIDNLLLVTLVAGALAACGGDKHVASGPSPARAAQTAPASGDASAEQVAAEARGDIHCPAGVKPNPPGVPVTDVVGVRPGMSYEEAAHVVMCSNPLLVVTAEANRGYDIKTYGQKLRQGFSARFAEPRVQKTGRQIVQEMERDAMYRSDNVRREDMKPGQSKWFVSTMGMPGQEKVISAAREEWFDAGRNPTMDSVEQALVAKYGTPTQKNVQRNYRELRWAYDPRGRVITETSPLYTHCSATADPNGSTNLSADCGVAIAAMIQPQRDNLALAQYLQVGTVDEAGGYQALTETQQGLEAADAARQARQVQSASKNAQAPQL